MATTRTIAATPSPPPHIHTPTTPRYGFADSWEPFSPRKSSRIAAAAAAAAAAAPSAPTVPAAPATPRRSHARAQLRSPRVSKALFHGPVMSPEPTPRKKTMSTAATPEVAGGSRVSSSSSSSKLAAAAQQQTHAHRANLGMLPTPAKTPSKKVHAASQNESNIAAIARNLFHTNAHSSLHTSVDEVMASPTSSSRPNSPRKAARPKKYTGYTLESFTVVEEEEEIPIFTDSQDRVPEADRSSQNPFYGEGAVLPVTAQEQPARRRSSRRNNVSIPGEGKQSVEEATRRDDGLIYVFRGKKIFRKFTDVSAQEQDSRGRMGSPERTAPGRRLTRSAIKPRLLFPRSETAGEPEHLQAPFEGTTEDEEAVTDIEEGNELAEDKQSDKAQAEAEADAEQIAKTPTGRLDKIAPSTPPRAPRFAPASPPVTGRTTRAKKRSPFDGWRQTKSSTAAAGAATSHKRSADDLGATVSTPAKRSRAS